MTTRSISHRLVVGAIFLLAACGSTEPSGEVAGDHHTGATGRGTPSTLDVANWNVEWFGDPAQPPADAQQLVNVRDTILAADFDVWAMEEVVNGNTFQELVRQLPGYAGVIANDTSVTSGSTYYTSTEQKVALIYKTSLAKLVSAKVILTANDYDFGGRPPLEVKLNVTLNGATEERVFIVLHMKAMPDAAAWQRRANASAALKAYLDTTYPTQKVIVLGDWNDDLDSSITSGKPTPYGNFLSDNRYTFSTLTFSQNSVSTTCNYPEAIDHQLATNELYTDLVNGSVEVHRADQKIPNYCSSTSDHYPVMSRFQFPGGATASLSLSSPAGGERWAPGSTHDVTWTAPPGVAKLTLQYSLDNGTRWSLIANDVPATTGRHRWAIPAKTKASTKARIRISNVASGSTGINSAPFTIKAR